MNLISTCLGLALLAGLSFATPAWSAEPLQLEAKIPLGNVSGRIDHFGYDAKRQRLFVAELGNNSVGIVDLKAGKVAGRLQGLSEPQGVAYHQASETLYVANAGDGSVRLYQAYRDSDFLQPAGAIALGDDADNIRLDKWRDRIVVGYGKGALAVVDPASRRKIADVALPGHPESFQFDEQGQRIFANVPNARQIAVVDVGQGRQIANLELGGARSNFPMAVDGQAHRLLVVTRSPARLIGFATDTGKQTASVDTCGDSDDLSVDPRRQRVYVTCGEGVVEAFGQRADGFDPLGRVRTVSGARTSLFVPDADRLYVAVRASGGEPAAIWIFRPAP
jgi:DNA-binding beta-propeller fold protein YncE